MTKLIVSLMGLVFIAIGFIGISAPGIFGMHLSFTHNLIHVVSGCLALYFGLATQAKTAKMFAFTFGTFYGLLGAVGLMAVPGVASMPQMGYDEHLLIVMPNVLEFGTADSVAHVVAGILFMVASILPEPFKLPSAKREDAPTSTTMAR